MKKFPAAYFVVIILSVLLSAPFVHAADTLPSGVEHSEIEEEIEAHVSQHEDNTAGMSVAVFDSDAVLHSGHFGYSDMDAGTSVSEDTVFEWGSISKLLIWVSVFQLWEDGKIELNDDVRAYLPEDFRSELQYEDEVTMLNLMNHDAGFEDFTVDLFSDSLPENYSLENTILEFEPRQIYEPGTVTAYSNWGTSLAALVVEEVTGMRYVDYVHENIFEPLGMERTALYPDLSDNEWVQENREMTESYINTVHLDDNPSVIQLYPAGMATGVVGDLVKFGQAFIPNEGKGTPLFDDYSTLEEMLSPTDYYGDTDFPKNRHGFWEELYGAPVIGHSGGTSGFSSNFVFNIESGVGTVVMTNQIMEEIYTREMLEIIYGEYQAADTNVPDGLYQPARTTKDGPFSFMKYQTAFMTQDDLDTFWVHATEDDVEKIEYPTTDLLKLSSGETILRIIVLSLMVISILYSFISVAGTVIKSLFFRKRMRKDDARLPNFVLNSLILILMVNFVTVVTRVILYEPSTVLIWHYYLFLTLLILIPLSAIWLISRYSNTGRLFISKVFIGSTLLLTAFGIFFIIYFDLYQFWLI